MKDRYIKLDAIARIAKPMKALHEKEGYSSEDDKEEMGKMGKMDDHHKCACPCCGAPCEACNEAEEEDSEEYEDSEEESEDDSEDESKDS